MKKKTTKETKTYIIAVPAEISLRQDYYALNADINHIREQIKAGQWTGDPNWMPKKLPQLAREVLAELIVRVRAELKKRS